MTATLGEGQLFTEETGVEGPVSLATVMQETAIARFPRRPIAVEWPGGQVDRSEVFALVDSASFATLDARVQDDRRRGLPILLDWLEDQHGETWQERWLASGADAAGDEWAREPNKWLERHGRSSTYRLELMTSSLLTVVGVDVVRPSLRWLLTGGKKRKLARNMICWRDSEGFEQLRLCCEQDPAITAQAQSDTVFRCAVIIAAKGGSVGDITIGDVLEILELERDLRGRADSGSATFKVLREMGTFGHDVPTLREIRSVGQRSVGELVDRYPIACRPVRDLIVDYLKERQPTMDYSTLTNRAYVLGKCFWMDLERHQPGINSLHLSPDTASAWKRRLQTKSAIRRTEGAEPVEVSAERRSYLEVLAAVRAFYLDVSEWSLDSPTRWSRWVAPCPIRKEELTRRKAVRRRKARMDARTRDLLPVLPVLVRAVDQWRKDAEALLIAGSQVEPGEQFNAAGQTLVRLLRPHAMNGTVWASEPITDKRRCLNREEDHAFWAWAIIEVLRLTGVRIEELLELSHHSLVQYRLPDTGELVPLLQIVPSKTDTERLLVVSPELADVLSTIICRIRDHNGTVPLVKMRDSHEHIWLPPSPLLFQRRLEAEHHAISSGLVSTLLNEATAITGLRDQSDGASLHYTPHDFRRMFITDAILNGLPPHIAQVIAGHQDVNVTLGYKAVYPEESIQAHLAFLARRRSLRPSEEYRVPTDEEWHEFLGHFERRKLSIGTCARSFGSPCIHEHACVRCSMLWPDPAERSRLVEIRDNLVARIGEAEHEGWLGEVEGLRISLTGAEDKIEQIDRHLQNAATAETAISMSPRRGIDRDRKTRC